MDGRNVGSSGDLFLLVLKRRRSKKGGGLFQST